MNQVLKLQLVKKENCIYAVRTVLSILLPFFSKKKLISFGISRLDNLLQYKMHLTSLRDNFFARVNRLMRHCN